MPRALRFVAVIVSVCGLGASLSAPASAAPADTDRSFGQEGFANLDAEAGSYTSANDMAVAAGGSIYVLRSAQKCGSPPCAVKHPVTRLTPNGRLDGSFGSGGTSAALGTTEGVPPGLNASLALGADGRVVAAWIEQGRLVLRRLNPDGSLDASFGAAGTVRYDFGIPVGGVRIAVQSDGKVVVAAEPERGYGGDAVIVARFTAQGALDATFDGGVPVFTSLGSGFGGLSLTGQGGVLLAGPRCCSVQGRAVHVTRLDAAGALDSGFGRGGQVFVDDVASGVGVGAVAVLANGRIVVVGSSRRNGNAFALRLLPGGKLDHSFGHRGIAYIRQSYLEVVGAAVDNARRLVIFGTAPSGTPRGAGFGPRRLAVVRRLPDGRPDPTFAAGSVVRLGAGESTRAVAGGLQNGSKLVVLANSGSCFRTCPSPRNFVVRFIGGSGAPRCAGRRATIVGTRHGDKIVGTRRRDVIVALAGDDSVRGGGGSDVICGGRGNDRLVGGPGRDVLRGEAGRNRVRQ